jgi:mannosyltransferase OCH1-like enzyme
MIPKIIHQTWKNDNIPIEWQDYVQTLKTINPDWSYKLWTDKLMLEFVEKEFKFFLKTYVQFPKNVMRADVFRYLLMYKIGGVYLDLDYEVLKPFDFGAHKVILPYNREIKFGDQYDGLGNCFFGSIPGHEFWLDAINSLKVGKNLNPQKIDMYSTLEEETTGPAFLTRVFNQKEYFDIYNPQRLIYHPNTPLNEEQRSKIINNNVSLGVHHCAGSWRKKRKKSFFTRCKNVIKRILR